MDEVRHKLDREYERVFLRRMEEMKIIKQSKAIKDLSKDPVFPGTNFYDQLIQSERTTVKKSRSQPDIQPIYSHKERVVPKLNQSKYTIPGIDTGIAPEKIK